MDSLPTPRANAPYLSHHTGHTVILVGRVIHLHNTHSATPSAVVDSAGSVTVSLGFGHAPHLVPGNVAQFIGRVGVDLGVKALSVSDLGPDVDLNLYNIVVEASHTPALQSIFMPY